MAFIIGVSFCYDNHLEVKKKEEKKRKKTEYTIISHTSQTRRAQNIHVMLSYAIIKQQPNKQN